MKMPAADSRLIRFVTRMPPPISVLYCFPRSGGTLLSQCLLCAPATVVLSEVNPAASFLPVEQQASAWFGLITAKEAAALEARTYLEKVTFLARRCAKKKRRLCVRDWVAINFVPGLTPLAPEASGVLEQRLFLRDAGFEVTEAVLLRRSEQVFRSMRRHIPGFQSYPLREFAQHYRGYLRAVADIPRFQLEELTAKPADTLRRICAALRLDFPPRFQSQFHRQEHVTGNNTLPLKPASASATRIESLPTPTTGVKSSPRERALFASLDALAGYATEP